MPKNLPKFLLADDGHRDFIVHTESPAFIAEVVETPTTPVLEPHWFELVDIEHDAIKDLMREATTWYLKTLTDEAARN